MKQKRLLVISAPSGAGKTSITRMLLNRNPSWQFSVSATTRKQRPNEINGRDYFFLSKEDFKHKIENNEFVEYEEVFGNYYGTLKSETQRLLQDKNDTVMIFDIDVKGALSIKKNYPEDALLVFITVPSVQELRNRLMSRKTETEDVINQRVARAEMELQEKDKFDNVVVNDILERAVKEIENFYSQGN